MALSGSIYCLLAAPSLSFVGERAKGVGLILLSVSIVAWVVLIGAPRFTLFLSVLQGMDRVWGMMFGATIVAAVMLAIVLLGHGVNVLANSRNQVLQGIGFTRRPTLRTWRAAARCVLGAPLYVNSIPGGRGALSLYFIVGSALLALPLGVPFLFLNVAAEAAREVAPVGFLEGGFEPMLRGDTVSRLPVLINVFFWSGVTSICAFVLGLIILRSGRRRASRLYQKIQLTDTRAPVLFLRSFRQDGRPLEDDSRGVLHALLPRGGLPQTLDEVLLECAAQVGPLVAIGRPGEAIPPLGAARQYCRGDEWTDVVTQLAQAAPWIAMSVDDTQGIGWELEMLKRAGHLRKTIFFFNPETTRQARAELQSQLLQCFGVKTPMNADNGSNLVAMAINPNTDQCTVFWAPVVGRHAHACVLNWAVIHHAPSFAVET
jgi:hypothetical protein